MKFTDVLKACLRYWYIIVICIVLCCPIAIFITYDQNSYSAKSTLLVDKSDNVPANETLSSSYIESVIKEANMVMNHNDFLKITIDKLGEVDANFAASCSVNSLRANLSFDFKKGDNFFNISYKDKHSGNATAVVEIVTQQLIDEFGNKIDTKSKFVQVYSIELTKNMTNIPLFAIVGMLIGLVLGIVIITFMVVFNPYIENEELLVSQTNVELLTSLDKEKEAK